MNRKLVVFIIFCMITLNINSYAQVTGREEEPEFNADTTFIFESPRPLIIKGDKNFIKSNSYGLDVLLSESGFGMGVFWQKQFMGGNMIVYSHLVLSGARNTDEFDQFVNGNWQVINKINRVYKFPLTFGIQQFIFKDALSESLQPFLSLGVGPSFILSTPYTYDRVPNGEVMGWFKSFSYADVDIRFGGSLGIGAYFGNINNSILGVNIKYYYVPFGGNGIESIIGLPMKNLGGVFLSLTIGSVY